MRTFSPLIFICANNAKIKSPSVPSVLPLRTFSKCEAACWRSQKFASARANTPRRAWRRTPPRTISRSGFGVRWDVKPPRRALLAQPEHSVPFHSRTQPPTARCAMLHVASQSPTYCAGAQRCLGVVLATIPPHQLRRHEIRASVVAGGCGAMMGADFAQHERWPGHGCMPASQASCSCDLCAIARLLQRGHR